MPFLTFLHRLHFGQLSQGLFHSGCSGAGRPFPSSPLPSADPRVWVFSLLGQHFHLRLSRLQALFQPGFPSKGPTPGTGADPHAVLRYLLQGHQVLGQQGGHDLGQQFIQGFLVLPAKVRQQVVVHWHAPA